MIKYINGLASHLGEIKHNISEDPAIKAHYEKNLGVSEMGPLGFNTVWENDQPIKDKILACVKDTLKDFDLNKYPIDAVMLSTASLVKSDFREADFVGILDALDIPAIDIHCVSLYECSSLIKAIEFGAKFLDGMIYKNILIVAFEETNGFRAIDHGVISDCVSSLILSLECKNRYILDEAKVFQLNGFSESGNHAVYKCSQLSEISMLYEDKLSALDLIIPPNIVWPIANLFVGCLGVDEGIVYRNSSLAYGHALSCDPILNFSAYVSNENIKETNLLLLSFSKFSSGFMFVRIC